MADATGAMYLEILERIELMVLGFIALVAIILLLVNPLWVLLAGGNYDFECDDVVVEMKPYFQDGHCTIYNKDCRSMDELPDESVQCCVTSPPYFGLRMNKCNEVDSKGK